jgi:hypothetical protein
MGMLGPRRDVEPKFMELFRDLGLDDRLLSAVEWRVRASANAVDEEMSSVYAQLNRELQTLVALHSIEIVHITAEGRVLVDPAHRNVIRTNYLSGSVATITCSNRDNLITDATSFLEAQKSHWTLLTWVDFVDIIALFATGAASLKVLPHDAPVHYSIFGRDRILLQEPQRDATERKRLWYLESEGLVRLLAQTTADLLAQTRTIPSTGFGAILQWLYSESIFPLVGAEQMPEDTWEKLNTGDIERLRSVGVLTEDTRSKQIRFLPDLTRLVGW